MKIDSRFLKQVLEKGDKPGMPDDPSYKDPASNTPGKKLSGPHAGRKRASLSVRRDGHMGCDRQNSSPLY